MGAPENAALMALAGSLAKIDLRLHEGVELLKDILSVLEADSGISADDASDNQPGQMAPAPSAMPADMAGSMEAILKSVVAQNPALGLMLQTMQASATKSGDGENKQG